MLPIPFARRRLRLKTRFLLHFTSLIVAIMALVVLLVEKRMGELIARQAQKRGLSIARNLAAVSQASLVTSNDVALTRSAERVKREEGIADVVILDREGRVAAHTGRGERQGTVPEDPVSRRAAASREEVVVPVEIPREDGSTERGLDIAVPVFIETSHDMWGTVRIRLSTEDMHRQIRNTRLMLLGVGLGAVGLGVLGSFSMARRITGPVSELVGAAIRAAAGDLRTGIHIGTGDELEELAGNFNEMIRQIEANQRAIKELNWGLEDKVRARTAELSRANEALKRAYDELKEAEAQIILSEKMAGLGQFVAGIAHEINTPSSAISAAIYNMTAYLETLTRQIRTLTAAPVPTGLEARFYDIIGKALSADFTRKRASTADIREWSRGLEAVLAGQGLRGRRDLALTFARLGLHHEIEDLVGHLGATLPPVCIEFLENVGNLAIAANDIRLSIESITGMVRALKGYSRVDQARMTEADIHDGLETTLTILRSQIKYGIVVERKYSKVPRLACNTNELNQVWTNIIHNAIQAMNGVGKLTIETCKKDDWVAVRISDTGPGIPAGIRGRIFDPFFTTKDQGEGSGLGLGISQQIVQRHCGKISVESEPGRTTFEVLIPLTPQAVETKG